MTVTVLADKIDLIRGLVVRGFEFTAYLPAWYKIGGRRYDCVQLARRAYAERAQTRDFDDILSTLQPELMTMLVSEAELAAACASLGLEHELPS